MDLVGIEIKTTHDFVSGDERGDTWIVRGAFRQIIDHPSGASPGPWPGQLDLGEQPITAFRIKGLQLPADLQHLVHCRGIQKLDQERRKRLERNRLWYVLIAQRREPMVG